MSPLEFVSGLALRHFGADRAARLRDRYLSLRAHLSPLMRTVYGAFDAEALKRHLDSRIDGGFEILMVHSSMNQLKPMYTGTPLELVRMLVDWCGPRRTLVMPAFYFGEPGDGGAFETFRRRPRFDVRRTPSQMGLATELFRRYPGVVQSRHPVYRVAALGPLARELTAGHERASYPAGRGTPFEFMAAHATTVIGLGKSMQVMTQAHHVEGLLEDEFPVPYQRGESLHMTLVDGAVELPFELTRREYQGRFDMWRLHKILRPGDLSEWRFHHAPMFSADARRVTESLVAAARRGQTLYAVD